MAGLEDLAFYYSSLDLPARNQSASILDTFHGFVPPGRESKSASELTRRPEGHVVQFFRAPYDVYASGHKHFGGTHIPFMLHVPGDRFAIVSDAKQITAILNDNDKYSFDYFVDHVYRRIGKVTEEARQLLWRTPDQGYHSLHPNPKGLVLAHNGRELLHKQFLAKEPFESLVQKVLEFVEQGTCWENISGPALLASDERSKVLSLHHWVRDITVLAQAKAFFGPVLLEIEPGFTDIFDQWDKNSWMITYQLPDFLAKTAVEAREKLVKVCKAFLDVSGDENPDNVALVRELTNENRHAGLSNEDCARILMIIMWGINSNVQLATFWMVAYILRDRELQTAIMKETEPIMTAIESSIKSDPAALREICRTKLVESCPVLNATFDEVLRVCFTGIAFRKTTTKTYVNNFEIPANTMVYMPQRHLLLDEDIFGPDASVFDPYRFLNNKKLLRHENYRPFGGGLTLCSGKTVARFEVLAFVSWLFWRIDMKVVPPGKQALGVQGMAFPRLDLERPSLGMSKQVEGDNLIIEAMKMT